MLSSPITIVAIVLTIALAVLLPRLWILPAVVAVVADTAAILLLYRYWESQGSSVAQQALRGFGLFCIITYSVYLIVQLAMHIRIGAEANDKNDPGSR